MHTFCCLVLTQVAVAILYSQYRLCDYRQIKTVAIDLSALAETHNTDDRVTPAKSQAVGHDLAAESYRQQGTAIPTLTLNVAAWHHSAAA